MTNRMNDRRTKYRFEIQREMKYKVTGDKAKTTAGTGRTLNLCSMGVAFAGEHQMQPGSFVELSIDWPVLLDQSCPMRLIAFGRVLRANGTVAACSIDKYEFRTAPRAFQVAAVGRSDEMLQRWAEGVKKGLQKEQVAGAAGG